MVDRRQGTQPPRLPVAHRLGRVVHGGMDVFPDEFHRYFPSALEGNIGELHPEGLLHHDRDDLVFLFRAGPAHVEFPRFFLHGIEVLLGALVRGFGVYPEDEIVEGKPADRREVLPVERNPRGDRCREEVVQGDDDDVRVALLPLHVHESFRSRAAGLVDHDEGRGGQLVLADQRADEPGHDVRAAARARRNDELHGLRRLPGFCRPDG